jgi:uncharacterized protein YjbI with pentapeptide repeats
MSNERITQYINGVFAPYEGGKSVQELKEDLLSDLQERFQELKAAGKNDDEAYKLTLDGIGNIEQTVREVADLTRSLERQVLTSFNASDLHNSDFAGVTVHQGKFEGSALSGSDFSGADLTGSSFKSSDVTHANFSGANLTDCSFSTMNLAGAIFDRSTLVRTNFSKAWLGDVKFSDLRLVDVNLTQCDLRQTVFSNCVFDGVNFNASDLSGLCLDGQTFISVKFDKAWLGNVSFVGATLKNVLFKPPFSLTNKYYKAIQTINFSGAKMDKLTYASLKGLYIDLSKVIVI